MADTLRPKSWTTEKLLRRRRLPRMVDWFEVAAPDQDIAGGQPLRVFAEAFQGE